MTLTNADLDQLDALAEAATPGPWHYDDGITDDLADPPERGKPPLVEDGRAYWIASTDGMVGEGGFTQEEADANGRLVAAARLAIPALVAEVRRLRAEVERPWIGCPGCAGELAGLVDRLCGSCRAQTVAAFGCGAPDCRPRCSSCEPAAAVPGVAIGARLRDFTVAQLDALPVGARFEDADLDHDPEDDLRKRWAFTKVGDVWDAPGVVAPMSSAHLFDTWRAHDDDYRLAHLPTEETSR